MMLSLFTRRVALSAHRSAAIYTRILPSPVSTLRARTIADTRLPASTVRANPKPNASTEAAATTKKTGPSAKSNTKGRTKPRTKLTPEEKEARTQLLRLRKELDRGKKVAAAAALRAKRKAQAEKEKEAAAQKRKRLAEKKKKMADAEKERKEKLKEKEREKKAKAKARETKAAKAKEMKARETKAKETKEAREAEKPKLIKPPPRRMTGFSLYLRETKKTVQVGMADWRNLTEEEKEKYNASARVVRDERREEFNAFLKTITPLELRRYNREQAVKGRFRIHAKFPDLSPQRGGPFMKYIKEFRTRPDQAGKRMTDMARAAGEAWKSLTEEEKDQYRPKPTEPTPAKENSQSL